MTNIYDYLQEHKIEYVKYEHPAVFTCEEAEKLCPEMPGESIKNLFLRDDKGKRHFLVVVGKDKIVDLKKLQGILGVSRLSFGSPERLEKYLGVTPGSVTILALINDPDHSVELIIDAELEGKVLQCHPLINTATLVIQPTDLKNFLASTGHKVDYLAL